MLPSADDVALVIRTRSKRPVTDGGGDTGEFTETTRPTLTQVEALIERAGRVVYAVLGAYEDMTDETLRGAIVDLIATRAAAEVERSAFPEQQGTTGSADALFKQYESDLKALTQSVRELGANGAPGAGDTVGPVAGTVDVCATGIDWDRW